MAAATSGCPAHSRDRRPDGIAPIGNKFHGAAALGPESQPNTAGGDYRRTIYFRFGA
jgi:hypothetical protein